MRARDAVDHARDFLGALWIAAQRDQITLLGAALAYYAVFSLGSLLFLIVHIAGQTLSEPLAEGRVISWVAEIIGPSGAGVLRLMIETANQHGGGWFATWVGLGSLLAGATGMVFQLKTSLNAIWGAQPPSPSGLIRRAIASVLSYLVPILMIVATGFLLVVSLSLNAMLLAFGARFQAWLPGGSPSPLPTSPGPMASWGSPSSRKGSRSSSPCGKPAAVPDSADKASAVSCARRRIPRF